MGIREQKQKIKEAGSRLRDDADGELLEFESVAGDRYEVRGVMSGVYERKAVADGGLLMDFDGQCRVRKDAFDKYDDDVRPETGWRVRRSSGLGRVYGVEQVVMHDGDVEWRLDLAAQ